MSLMASVLVHTPQIFNTFDTMGQSQVLPTKHDPNTYDDKGLSPVETNPTKPETLLHSNVVVQAKELLWESSDSSTKDAVTGIPDVHGDDSGICSTNTNSSLDNDTNDELTSDYEELLCAGETLDDVIQVTHKEQVDTVDNNDTGLGTNNDINKAQDDNDLNNVDSVIKGSTNATMDWSEKKRQFSIKKQNQSFESSSSDVSSGSRHSVSSYLNARECDAEEILAILGFGCDNSIDIPDRFLADNNLVSSNTYIEKTTVTAICDDDVFASGANSTRTSIESSWSGSSFGRLPSRFTSSLSRSSLSSLSELEDDDSHVVIPSIIEPDKDNHDDGFDLMRHLRLNRVHNDKGFLEPVTEEQEVSSISSGSAQTKVAAQQDSFDSIGNISVATKISVPKLETEDFERKGEHDIVLHTEETESPKREEHIVISPETDQTTPEENLEDITNDEGEPRLNVPNAALNSNLGNSEFREEGRDSISNTVITDTLAKENEIDFNIAASELDNFEPKPDYAGLASLKPYISLQLPQESFELEEIATSEENLDKIQENISRNSKRRETLKRDYSDDSSGFGDDAIEANSKKSIPKSMLTLTEDASRENVANSAEKVENRYLDVPSVSTPKDNAAARRSRFSKRQSWSTTKQKRVLFEDEVQLQKCRSLDDLPSQRKLFDIPNRSLGESLPESLQNAQSNENLQNKYFQSQDINIPSPRSSQLSLESDHDMQCSYQSEREFEQNDIPLLQSERLSSDTVENTPHTSSEKRFFSKSYSFDMPWGKSLLNSKSSSSVSLKDDSSSRKTILKSRSLDIPSPTLYVGNSSGASISLSRAKSDKPPRMEVHSQVVDLPQRQRTSSENKAISNIKEFMSNLWSLRGMLKKTPIISRTESLPTSTGTMLEEHRVGSNENNERFTEECLDSIQQSLVRLDKTTPFITVDLCQHQSALDELTAFKEDLQKYYSSFISMDIISTSQEKYYSRKLQAKFAWDILFIRRLRSYIKEELDEITSNLEYRTTVPSGLNNQMVALLRLQSGLREHLTSLANTTARYSLYMQPATRMSSLEMAPSTLREMEDKIRSSVVQEIKSTFELQLGELRQEMKAKDSLIEELLKRITKNQTPL